MYLSKLLVERWFNVPEHEIKVYNKAVEDAVVEIIAGIKEEATHSWSCHLSVGPKGVFPSGDQTHPWDLRRVA